MSKAILISIKPYWVFLIIARIMGWKIDKEKTIEVRKNFPKDQDWNRNVKIYCSRDKKSFSKIPKEYQPFMEKFLGKVIGEFVCDRIDKYKYRLTTYEETPYKGKYISKEELAKSCLSIYEINDYLNGKNAYFWHISRLKIYDKPKDLSEFESAFHCFNIQNVECKTNAFGEYVFQHYKNSFCRICKYYNGDFGDCNKHAFQQLKKPPQSWCYVEEL